MSRLTQKAPITVPIDGVEIPINTDFRGCLLTIAAIEDVELTQYEKADIVLSNLYGEHWPEDIAEAIKQSLWFLSCGQESDGKKHSKLFDWDMDAERIHAALLARGVNIDTADMHWWTFNSYINELPGDSAIVQVIQLRDKYQRGKLDKEERKLCDRIGWDVIEMRKPDPDAPSDEEVWQILKGE